MGMVGCHVVTSESAVKTEWDQVINYIAPHITQKAKYMTYIHTPLASCVVILLKLID